MKPIKLVLALLAMFVFVLSSCTSNSADEDDKLYEQSIRKSEIKNSDV